MSSAENGKPAGRLVFVDAADLTLHDTLLAQVIRVRHGRAPADPAEAIKVALFHQRWPHDEFFNDNTDVLAMRAVLAALGVPSSSPTRSDNA